MRFEAEAEAVERVNNKHVIEIYDAGRDGSKHYIAMEFIEGTNLKELLELGTHFSLTDVADITLQVADGLDAIHALGIVHRDIKPANIVRTQEGRIFITDFGIVKLSEDATLSQEGSIVGTPNYMSPEQIIGSHKAKITSKSDIFSLGVIVYELLTRKKPFEGKDISQTMYNITHVHPASPLIYNPSLPRAIEPILYRALAKDPIGRYERASDMSIALSRLENDERVKNVTLGGASSTERVSHTDSTSSSDTAAGYSRQVTPSKDETDTDSIPRYMQRQKGGSQSSRQGYASAVDLGKPVFCTECGMENAHSDEYCVRCGLKLLKRNEFYDELKRVGRVSYNPFVPAVYLTINVLAVLTLLLVLWYFLQTK